MANDSTLMHELATAASQNLDRQLVPIQALVALDYDRVRTIMAELKKR